MKQTNFPARFAPSATLMKNLLTVSVIGVIIILFGFFAAPTRTWINLLLANYYLLSLGVAGIVFIAFQYITNAGWSVGLRRVPEAMTNVLPVAGLVMLVVLFGIHSMYEWSHDEVVAKDHLLQTKTWWLNSTFFSIRTIFYIGLWILFAYLLRKTSQAQDYSAEISLTDKNRKIAGTFIVVIALTFTFASIDWIMSLEPHWYSTIFGLYNFTGMFLNGLAAITILAILLKRMGPFQNVLNSSHLHDLGKLIFAFSTFWMYLWFSQYMLIWYSNIPEETTYFLARLKGSWTIFTLLNLLFNWAIPFVVLLPVWTKKNEGLLLKVCIIIMIGHWIDLFWMIMPPFMNNEPLLNIWEIGPIASAISGFFYITFKAFSQKNTIPVNDPMLVESIAQQH